MKQCPKIGQDVQINSLHNERVALNSLLDLTLLSTTKQQAVATGTGSKNLAEYLSFNNGKTYTGLDGYGQANPHDDTRNLFPNAPGGTDLKLDG